MSAEDFEEPPKGSPLSQLAAEDIDMLSVDELNGRIVVLRREIERAEARIGFATRHKANADALFKK